MTQFALRASAGTLALVAAAVCSAQGRSVALALVSHDETAVLRYQELRDLDRTMEKVRALYPAPRFSTVPYRDRALIVLDLESGLLAEVKDQGQVLRSFASNMDANGVMDLAKVGSAGLQAMRRLFGPQMPRPGADGRTVVAIGISAAFEVEHQGRFFRAVGSPDQELTSRQEESLRGTAAPPLRPADVPRLQSEALDRPTGPRGTITFKFQASGPDVRELLAAATEEAGKQFEVLYRAREDAALAVLQKIGGGEVQPGVAVPYSQLTTLGKDALLRAAESSFRFGGFPGPEAAAEFVRDARSVRMTTRYGIRFANPSGGTGEIIFGSVRGGRVPPKRSRP